MRFRGFRAVRVSYCWYILPYNVVHVLVVIVIDILVPSCDSIGVLQFKDAPRGGDPPMPDSTNHRRLPNWEVPPYGRRDPIKLARRFSSVNGRPR